MGFKPTNILFGIQSFRSRKDSSLCVSDLESVRFALGERSVNLATALQAEQTKKDEKDSRRHHDEPEGWPENSWP